MKNKSAYLFVGIFLFSGLLFFGESEKANAQAFSGSYSYSECKSDGGSEAYCSQFSGAPQSSTNISNASAGSCRFNSDCGNNFTCYQDTCMDDATYQENVSWINRTGNAVSQVLTPGGSIFDDGTNSTSSSSGGELTMIAYDINGNPVFDPDQYAGAGNTNSNIVNNNNNSNNTGSGNTNGIQTAKCSGANFTEIGGICFPVDTGMPNPEFGIVQIIGNLFSWLMGLFSVLSLAAFVISGIQYVTSAGDSGQAETAKKNALNAVLGIIVGFSGFVIVQAVNYALEGQGFF